MIIPLCHLRDISPILGAKFLGSTGNSPLKIGGVPEGGGGMIILHYALQEGGNEDLLLVILNFEFPCVYLHLECLLKKTTYKIRTIKTIK